MSKLEYATVVEQEEAYLRRLHPTPEDVPSFIRSQVKSIYRYGQRPDCSQKLHDFKFCLTLKSLHPEERRDAWIRKQAEWWAKRRLERSSEDIWDIREEPLESFPKPLTEDGVVGAGRVN